MRAELSSLAAMFVVVLLTVGLMFGPNSALAVETSEVDFARDIRPILSNSCFACHGPDRNLQENDLRLDSPQSAVPLAIQPGSVSESPLVARILSTDPDEQMPPPSSNRPKVTADQLEKLKRWIEQGAVYTDHWAYQIPERPEVPVIEDEAWVRNEVDAFILAANEQRGLQQAVSAGRRTLIRRLSFDLLGLPPSLEEVNAFVQDDFPDAYERLVDRVLESEHFGERMATLWLDLVRFADTCGYHGDQHREVDIFRDYVIRAFNQNKGFDQFTIEQLAGDLLADPTTDQLIGSGYNRLLQTTREGGAQAKEYRAIYDADRVRNASSVWMGITLGCAQCHDHKFDPFSTDDFYRFAAFFADIEEVEVGEQKANFELPTREQRQLLRQLDDRVAAQQQIVEQRKAEIKEGETSAAVEAEESKLKELQTEQTTLNGKIRRTLVSKSIKPRMTRILPRGNWLDESGQVVEPAVPAVFGEVASSDRLTRLDLARWLTSRENPLTARVFVNHLWKVMFGEGLVRTADDFGAQGQYPQHRALLDWLAVEFQDSGWNVKYLLRLIARSNTYRQSSQAREDLDVIDPYNEFYTRQNRFRLDAEAIRDNALAVSGLLMRDVGGRSVKPYQPAGYWGQLNFPKRTYVPDAGTDQYRRGVYNYWCRTFLHPSMSAFDAPTREECTAQRARSNTPLQALVLLNDPSYVEAAQAFAVRIRGSNRESVEVAVDWAFQQALSRQPTTEELELVTQLYRSQLTRYQQDAVAAREVLSFLTPNAKDLSEDDLASLAAWTSVARALLNLHETITRT